VLVRAYKPLCGRFNLSTYSYAFLSDLHGEDELELREGLFITAGVFGCPVALGLKDNLGAGGYQPFHHWVVVAAVCRVRRVRRVRPVLPVQQILQGSGRNDRYGLKYNTIPD
jgi:hypothetical protein